MVLADYLVAFLGGGFLTTLVVFFELSGYPLLSRLAALFPIVTWISYLIIGTADTSGGLAVSSHALFVLIGTLIAWVPYMLIIYYFAPKFGAAHAILIALGVFIVLALLFAWVYKG